MSNFLTDRLIAVNISIGSSVRASILETLALLMRNEVDSFPALRPHQRHAWHAFLVQLGALAMHRAGLTEPPKDSEEWLRLIRGLTPDYPEDEPWSLVVDDITMPAFMQPPVSSADKLSDYKSTVETPGGLDMLVTSKNHDLKSSVASSSETDEWIFALISLQTAEGFGGAGNYGISRMNGGLGCRPAFSLTPSARPGIHLRRDIVALLDPPRDATRHGHYARRRNRSFVDPAVGRGQGGGANAEGRRSVLYRDLPPHSALRRSWWPPARYQGHLQSSQNRCQGSQGRDRRSLDSNQYKGRQVPNPGRGRVHLSTHCRLYGVLGLAAASTVSPTDAERSPPKPMMLVARGMVRGQARRRATTSASSRSRRRSSAHSAVRVARGSWATQRESA